MNVVDLADIAFIFGGAFCLGLLITFVLWFKFFSLLKAVDEDLYELIRFRLKPSSSKSYRNVIFKKEFESHPNQKVRCYSCALYWVGGLAQWAFNLYLLLIVVAIVIRITVN